MLRIALTGGIASGKSTVADLFEKLGASVIRTDEISREMVSPGSDGLQAIVDTFGAEILDKSGELDRERLRRLVFSDEARRKELEAILHPMIQQEVNRRLQSHEAEDDTYAIVEIPLLAETGGAGRYDRVLVVDCDPSVQLARLRKRDDVDEQDARAALAAQASREERLAIADDIIDNNRATLAELEEVVRSLHKRYTAGK